MTIPKTLCIFDEAVGVDDLYFETAASWAKVIKAGEILGECVDCGKRIPAERLEALPHTTKCVKCSDEKIKDADVAMPSLEELQDTIG